MGKAVRKNKAEVYLDKLVDALYKRISQLPEKEQEIIYRKLKRHWESVAPAGRRK